MFEAAWFFAGIATGVFGLIGVAIFLSYLERTGKL